MRVAELGPRLLKVAEMVKRDERIADIGTDHGYLPIHLLNRGVIKSALLTDMRKGPLNNAQKNARRCGLYDKMEFILCRGLSGVSEDSADSIIIAGMGGETIADILKDCPWAKKKRLILQPMSSAAELRGFLQENGYEITDESIVKDEKRFYFIIEAKGGVMEPMNETELYTGTILKNKDEPVFYEYIKKSIHELRRAAAGMARSSKSCDIERRLKYEAVLAGLIRLEEERNGESMRRA